MKIIADASLPGLSEAFPEPFKFSVYHDREDLLLKLKDQDILLCRSTLKVNEQLLKNSKIKTVATASSGIDHIDEKYLKKQSIELISAKGSNAIAVADYVVACLAWIKKNKGSPGLKAAVVGLGEVGSRIKKRLMAMGLDVIGFDPPKALIQGDFESCTIDALKSCDIICLHAELHDNPPFPSRNLFNAEVLASLKNNAILINASRGGIVNEADLLSSDKSFVYCVDVYDNEPDISQAIIHYATLCTPHIAGHSLEAKFEAVNQISRYLHRMEGLALPVYLKPRVEFIPEIKSKNWEDVVLSLYDPSIETRLLKQANDLKACFLSLRKAHQFRHDFQAYSLGVVDEPVSKLLGF